MSPPAVMRFEAWTSIALICAYIALFYQGVDGLTVVAGQPTELSFPLQGYNVSSSNHRACRFYKNDTYFGVIGRGESQGNCTNTKICENIQFLIDQVNAMVKISRTRVNNGGNYTVHCISSGSTKASDFKKFKQLYVIEANRTTQKPASTLDMSTPTGESSAPAATSDADLLAIKPMLFMRCLCCLLLIMLCLVA